MRIEGPVEIAFTTVDPGDYGEPRIFAEDDVTFVTVPTWATIANLRVAHEKTAEALVIAVQQAVVAESQVATLRAALDGLVAAATTFLANYDAVAESDDPMAAGAHEEGWWITGAAALDDALDEAGR